MRSFDDRTARGARRPDGNSPSTDASYDVLAHLYGRVAEGESGATEAPAPAGSPALDEHGARVHLAMLRRSDDGSMAILDPAGVVVCWYARAGDRERRGATVLGRHVAQFYVASDAFDGLPQRHLESASACGRSTRQGWRLKADGRPFWGITDIRTIVKHDDSLAGFVHVIRPLFDVGEFVRGRRRAPRRTPASFRSQPTRLRAWRPDELVRGLEGEPSWDPYEVWYTQVHLPRERAALAARERVPRLVDDGADPGQSHAPPADGALVGFGREFAVQLQRDPRDGDVAPSQFRSAPEIGRCRSLSGGPGT